MAKAVQVQKPSGIGAIYDFVRECARKIGKEKQFLQENGSREEYLDKCGGETHA